MNILFVTPEYPKRGQPTTGFPNYLYRVSLALIQMGHKPIILSAGGWNEYRIDQEIEIWTVGIQAYTKSKFQTVSYILRASEIGYKLNKKIKEIEKKIKIDIIQFTSLYGIALFYTGKNPAVLRLSSYAKTAFSSYQTFPPTTVKVMAFFERMSARKCSALFAPCKKNAEVFAKDCKRSVKVIETPFVNDVQKYDNKYVNTELAGKKYVLFFGTLYIEKGILVIAKILETFLKANSEYYFVFIGDVCSIDGESAANILQRYAGKYVNRVKIYKALSHGQLYPIIQQSEFIVLPSLMENLSNACIEAMYFRKVVIGTDGASFEQLIIHGKNGFLCRIGDSQDLLDKMQIVVSMTEEDKIYMGELAKQRIDRLKPECVVKRLVQLYEYVVMNCKEK